MSRDEIIAGSLPHALPITMGQIKEAKAKLKKIGKEVDEGKYTVEKSATAFRNLIIKKCELSVVHAIALGYTWKTPANRRQPGKYLLLWDDGQIDQVSGPALRVFRWTEFKRMSIRKFLKLNFRLDVGQC